MALKFRKNYFSIYIILIILVLIIFFLFQSTFINFFYEKEVYHSTKIHSDIEISRNKFGLSKIKCKDINDYYFATGFMQSYDRFIQIETLRRIGKGELSSFLKEDFTEYDKIIRDLDLVKISKNIKNDSLNSDYNVILVKYVNGINFFLKNFKDKLPLEFGLINYEVDKYTVEDIYLIDQVYKLMKSNTLKVDLFVIINTIQFGKSKSKKLFDMLDLNVSDDMLTKLSSRKYTYGELNYLKKIYSFIEFINYGKPTDFDSPYYINSEGDKLISYNHYSKTFVNFGPYYQESYYENDTLSGLYNVGLPIPFISRKNQIVFSELINNKDYYHIDLYEVSDKKLKYKSIIDSTYFNFNITIDSIYFKDKIKLEYIYRTKSNMKVINYNNDNFSLALSIDYHNDISNNRLDYIHNLIFNDSLIDLSSNNFQHIYLNNDLNTVVEQGIYNSTLDSINIFDKKEYISNSLISIDDYYYNDKYSDSYHNKRFEELISDDHKFSLTDLRLINNDNKNIFAEEYLPKYLKIFKTIKNYKIQNNYYNKLKKWDYIDEVKSIESKLFKDINNNIIEEYLSLNYNSELFRYFQENLQFKNNLIKNLFSKLKDEEINRIVINAWKKCIKNYNNDKLAMTDRSIKVNHFLTYYNNNDLISLPVDNYKGSENSIKFFHNFEDNLITNNASLIFNLNENKNYLILNFGESARLESVWNKNLFEIWTTGGLVECKLEFDSNNKIIEIKRK